VKLGPVPATAEILPERADVGQRWSGAQELLHTNTTPSPPRAFEPEEVAGRCSYTRCVFPMGHLPRGSMALAGEHYGELPLPRADPSVPMG